MTTRAIIPTPPLVGGPSPGFPGGHGDARGFLADGTFGKAQPNYSFADPNQQNAFDLMASQLKAWGLDSLLGDLRNLIISGDTSGDTLTLALSQTAAYKERFAGNQERIANGLSALTPAQYIALENQYQQILQAYGLPQGFYDKHEDFTDFIGKDISAAELDSRAKIAHDQYLAAPDYVKALWAEYGFSQGDAIAGILDPKVATSVIQDRATQVGIGSAAAKVGLNVDQARAQQLQMAGVTQTTAERAYQQISQSLPVDQQIAQRFGTTFGQTQEENDLLLGQADAAKQRQTLYGEEIGLFKQRGGADQQSLGVSQAY